MKCILPLLYLIGSLSLLPRLALAATTAPEEPGASSAARSMRSTNSKAFIVVESPYGFAQTVEQLKHAIVANNFRFIRQQSVDYGFVPEQASSQREVILYFCNFAMLHEAIHLDQRVGVFLPCRITVIQTGDTVRIVVLNPQRLNEVVFPRLTLGNLCERMQDVYRDVLDEATL